MGGGGGELGLLHIEGFQPEWCISSMMYSRDTPFWSETLDIKCISTILKTEDIDFTIVKKKYYLFFFIYPCLELSERCCTLLAWKVWQTHLRLFKYLSTDAVFSVIFYKLPSPYKEACGQIHVVHIKEE